MDTKFILALLVVALGAVGAYYLHNSVSEFDTPQSGVAEVTTFEECVAAGNPVLRSVPERCATPDGAMFTKMVDGETDITPEPSEPVQNNPGTGNGSNNTPSEPVFCTMDAMMCPDGSYVGRTGPNCEFVCSAN